MTMTYCTDINTAEKVAGLRTFTVSALTLTPEKQNPPPPFNMSSLIQAADHSLHFTADKTKDVAQKLFEAGHITYHRGDSINLSEYGFDMLRTYAVASGIETLKSRRQWKEKAGAQQGHEAIRPSRFEAEDIGGSEDEQMLYATIRARAIASQMPAAEFDVQTISLESTEMVAGKPAIFLAKTRKMTAPGWRVFLKAGQGAEEGGGGQCATSLPTLEIGQQITAASGAVKSLITKAPPRYSEGSLVHKMESLGIGRPGTYASAIKTIKTKEYAVITSRFFHATDTGISAISTLTSNFSFLDYKYTASMEDRLDAITAGSAAFRETVSSVYQDLGREIKAIGGRVGESYPCPKCGSELRIRKGPKGMFWGCSKFPACKGTAEDLEGKPLLGKTPASST